MKAFRYSLQRVLDVRDAIVSRRETALAQSERDLNQCRKQREACREALRESAADQVAPGARQIVVARECLVRRAWFYHLADRLDQAARSAAEQIETVRECRQALQSAMIDRKVMESLSRRERQTWLANVEKNEQKAQDEMASAAHVREKGRDRISRSVHRIKIEEGSP